MQNELVPWSSGPDWTLAVKKIVQLESQSQNDFQLYIKATIILMRNNMPYNSSHVLKSKLHLFHFSSYETPDIHYSVYVHGVCTSYN